MLLPLTNVISRTNLGASDEKSSKKGDFCFFFFFKTKFYFLVGAASPTFPRCSHGTHGSAWHQQQELKEQQEQRLFFVPPRTIGSDRTSETEPKRGPNINNNKKWLTEKIAPFRPTF
jgi:hypothetical protein